MNLVPGRIILLSRSLHCVMSPYTWIQGLSAPTQYVLRKPLYCETRWQANVEAVLDHILLYTDTLSYTRFRSTTFTIRIQSLCLLIGYLLTLSNSRMLSWCLQVFFNNFEIRYIIFIHVFPHYVPTKSALFLSFFSILLFIFSRQLFFFFYVIKYLSENILLPFFISIPCILCYNFEHHILKIWL